MRPQPDRLDGAPDRPALRQLAEGGPQALSLNAIAKELGVSGPALYRYFAGRDELLTELVADAYDDLGAALEYAHARKTEGGVRYFHGMITPSNVMVSYEGEVRTRGFGYWPAREREAGGQ